MHENSTFTRAKNPLNDFYFSNIKAFLFDRSMHYFVAKTACNETISAFSELLTGGNVCTVHTQNLQKLMLEIHKCLNTENSSFMWRIFQTKDVVFDLRTKNLLHLPSTNTLTDGNDSLSFRGAILWNSLSDLIKSLATSASFKR